MLKIKWFYAKIPARNDNLAGIFSIDKHQFYMIKHFLSYIVV